MPCIVFVCISSIQIDEHTRASNIDAGIRSERTKSKHHIHISRTIPSAPAILLFVSLVLSVGPFLVYLTFNTLRFVLKCSTFFFVVIAVVVVFATLCCSLNGKTVGYKL